MALTPNDIENQKFNVRMRGFDRDQVASFLAVVGEDLARIVGERNALEEERISLKQTLEDYREREKGISETLRALRELSEKMKDDAKREAEFILREAHIQADQLLDKARVESGRIERQISELRVERDTFEDRLRLMIDEHQRLIIQRHQSGDWKEPARLLRRRTGEAEQ